MRCPHCGGLNPENSSFCIRCGRDVRVNKTQLPQPAQRQTIAQRPQQQQHPPAQPQKPDYPQPQRPDYARPVTPQQAPPRSPARPVSAPSASPVPAPRVPAATSFPSSPRNTPGTPASRTARPAAPTLPPLATPSAQPVQPALPPPTATPDEQFPPRTIAQLKALEKNTQASAQVYTPVGDVVNYGKKTIVRIAYRRCPAWQQIVTLLKALRAYDSPKFDTIVIQGVTERDTDSYWYTNGQLVFDRNTRLGSQILNRYQIETGDGFSSDSLRIVLSE